MCGIVGYLRISAEWRLPPDFLERACVTMAHRGPDDQGVIQLNDGQVGLGMRRLSIIDLSTGNQPMISEDGQVVIVFNGEIYNYLEIRHQLESQGCRFHTTSDTEVLLQAYQVYGVDCLH